MENLEMQSSQNDYSYCKNVQYSPQRLNFIIILMSDSKSLTSLTKQLQEFNSTISLIKRTQNNQCKPSPHHRITKLGAAISQSTESVNQSYARCNDLIVILHDRFKNGKYAQGQRLRVDKLQRDFRSLLTSFTILMEKYEKGKEQQLEEERSSYRQSIGLAKLKGRNGDLTSRKMTSYEEDGMADRVQMIEVDQGLLLQGQLIEQKARQLLTIKNQMENVLAIQQEIQEIVIDGGKKLDIIENNIDDANDNLKQARENMKEAKQHHKSANRKKFIIIAIIVAVVLAITIPILIKFT